MKIDSSINMVSSLVIFFLGIICVTPYFGNTLLRIVVILSAILLFVFMSATRDWRSSHLAALCLIVIFYIYALLGYAAGFSSASIGRYANLFGFFAPLIIYYLISYRFVSPKFRNSCKLIIYFVTFYLVVKNIYGLVENPLLLVQMNYIDVKGPEYLNIANTMVAAAWVLVGIIFISDRSNSKFGRLFFLVMFLMYCIVSTKTIMLLTFLFSLISLYHSNLKFYKLNAISLIQSSILIFATLVIFLPTLSQADRFSYLESRMYSIYLFFSSGYVSDEMVRLDLFFSSIVTFLENPIFGVGYDFIDLNGYAKNALKSGIGHHSTFADFLARFGIIGFAIVVAFIQPFVRDLFKNNRACFNLMPSMWFVSLFGISNNIIGFEFGFVIFLLLPILNYSDDKLYQLN